jgi:hypothetical protein
VTARTADIVAIARGAGIADSNWVRDETHFDQLTARKFDEGGLPIVFYVRRIPRRPSDRGEPRGTLRSR